MNNMFTDPSYPCSSASPVERQQLFDLISSMLTLNLERSKASDLLKSPFFSDVINDDYDHETDDICEENSTIIKSVPDIEYYKDEIIKIIEDNS